MDDSGYTPQQETLEHAFGPQHHVDDNLAQQIVDIVTQDALAWVGGIVMVLLGSYLLKKLMTQVFKSKK